MPDDLLPTLVGKADPDVVRAIGMLQQQIRLLRASAASVAEELAPLALAPRTLSIDEIQKQLQLNGGNDLNVTGLLGILAQPQTAGAPYVNELPTPSSILNGSLVNLKGVLYYLYAPADPGQWIPLSANAVVLAVTHAQRVAAGSAFAAANYPIGSLLWETDRTVLYLRGESAGLAVWFYMLGTMRGTLPPDVDQRPIDLTTTDANFRYEGTDFEEHYRWTGSTWQLLPNEETKINLLRNASFETYETDDPTIPAVYDPTYWALLSGVGTARQSTTQVRAGSYSLEMVNTAANELSYAQTVMATISATTNSWVRGRTVVFGCWVYASAATRVRLRINDGITTANSGYHSGVAGWEFLVITKVVSASATTLVCSLRIETGGAITVYFDGATLTPGTIPNRNAPPYPMDTHGYPWRVRVYTSAAVSIPNATATTIDWDSELYDHQGLHSLTSNPSRLTVPTAAAETPGVWHVYAAVRWPASAVGTRFVSILRNGLRQIGATAPGDAAVQTYLTVSLPIVDLAAGDYFEVQVYQSSGGALDVEAGSTTSFFGLVRVY